MRYPLLTVVVLASCQDKQPPPARPPRPRDGIAMIQPGAAPRQVLRYQLTKGATTTSEMVVDVEVKDGGQGGPLPTQILELETTVLDVAADGTARLRIAVTDARVRERGGHPIASDVLREQAEAIRGLAVTETLAPDGTVSDTRVEPGDGSGSGASSGGGAGSGSGAGSGGGAGGAATDRLRGQLDTVLRNLEQMAMRLPGEPVGPGAMWRERRTALPEAGIRVVSEVTYTLGEITGSKIVYAGVGDATGAAQKIERDGVVVDVTDTHGRSTTQGSIDLSRYAIDASTSSRFATTMAVLSGSAGAGAGHSTIEIATNARFAPAAPRPTSVASDEPPAEVPAPPPRTAIANAPPKRGKSAAGTRTRGAASAKRTSKPAATRSTDETTESEPLEPIGPSATGSSKPVESPGIDSPPGTR